MEEIQLRQVAEKPKDSGPKKEYWPRSGLTILDEGSGNITDYFRDLRSYIGNNNLTVLQADACIGRSTITK